MSFVVKGPGAFILLFRLEYKTSVVCHNVYTQKVQKIARRDKPHILASNRCEAFENLLHVDIAPLRSTLSGILYSKIYRYQGPMTVSINIHSFFVPDQETARYSICSAQENLVQHTVNLVRGYSC